MSQYIVRIPGGSTFDEINNMIRGEQAGASKFRSSVINGSGPGAHNDVTFEELAPGTLPPALTIKKQGEEAPSGSTKEWSGTMIVEGVIEAVNGFRSN